MARVLVAMSGGVDSSVAAALLVGEGHDVVGISLRLSDQAGNGDLSRCCSAADLRDAGLVAAGLAIPHYVLDEEETFRRSILEPFLEAYRRGRTPNPCITCNSGLKFGALVRIARVLEMTHVATGHFARVETDRLTGRRRIHRGVDREKDQSYFLYDLDEEQRGMVLFPLGGLTKREVYALASRLGLPVANKAESQDLCFVPGGDLRGFLRARLGGERPGEIVDRSGETVGRHNGVHEFTVGQRRGLGLTAGRPLYVIGLDGEANRVRVGSREDLDSKELIAGSCRLHEPGLRDGPFRAEAKIRSRHEPAPATVTPLGGGRLRVTFDEPQRAVTPGQAVVFYRGAVVLGGGAIEAGNLDPTFASYLDYGGSMTERA